ncbi:hypothetical protein [Bartonella sp. TP]|uniref:hypothetical protein n=1 Tax=Bartonella sp. TP TaxID=3057550 RepID=UPI0025B0384C|nr:hypothetical protein [Bartonella sp. TP]WJW79677.1 hypothetical protein QVL57_03960 [Bartonella sp. TP]
MSQKLKTDELDSLSIIRRYLVDCKCLMSGSVKANYEDCIISISEALYNVQELLKQHNFTAFAGEVKVESLANMISTEALKQGMIIHFDQGKKRRLKS